MILNVSKTQNAYTAKQIQIKKINQGIQVK